MYRLTLTFFSLLLIALVSTGCRTAYIPPTLPADQVAKVKEVELQDFYISILNINGSPVESFPKNLNPLEREAWIKSATDIFDVKPGLCTLDVKMEKGNGFAHGRVNFNAEAGKTYRVMGNVSEKESGLFGVQRVVFFVEDDQTGKLVSYLPDEMNSRPQVGNDGSATNKNIAAEDNSVEGRLQKIQKMKDNNLISEREYNKKRREILSGV